MVVRFQRKINFFTSIPISFLSFLLLFISFPWMFLSNTLDPICSSRVRSTVKSQTRCSQPGQTCYNKGHKKAKIHGVYLCTISIYIPLGLSKVLFYNKENKMVDYPQIWVRLGCFVRFTPIRLSVNKVYPFRLSVSDFSTFIPFFFKHQTDSLYYRNIFFFSFNL